MAENPLTPKEKRENISVRLNVAEKEFLQNEADNIGVELRILMREKLMGREAVTLRHSLPKPIKDILSDLLKMAGSLLLLSQKVERDTLYSAQVRQTMGSVFQIVNTAKKSVNEVSFNYSHYKKIQVIKDHLLKLQHHRPPFPI